MVDTHDAWRRLVDGEGKSWDAAVLVLYGRIRAFFVNKVGDQEADDLTHQTFARLLKVRASYEGRGTPRAFVIGVGRFVLLEHMRRRARDYTTPIEDLSVAAVDPRPSSVLVGRMEQRLVLEGLRRLSLDQQIVLELYYWEDMSDPEIADALESNANTIRGRRARAKERLRELLDEIQQGTAPASTSMDLERWARSVKQRVAVSSPPA